MKNKDLINELRTLLAKDFKSDANYDELKHDIIAEINSSSHSLDDQELESITQKQYFESRTSLSDTSLCITYVGVVLPICLSILSKSASWSDILMLIIVFFDLLLAGVLVCTRMYQRKKYNTYIQYYNVKLYCINQIREERKKSAKIDCQ